MVESPMKTVLAAVAVLMFSAPTVMGAEARLRAPGASDDLVDALKGSALSLEAARAEDSIAQDILAAARADYARLVGALYAQGYFAPVVHILVDGREASSISPLSVPARIGRVEITVEPGRPFSFSRAEIGPLAPGTELPEGYAAGLPAETATIRDAARAGVDGWRQAAHAKATIDDQRLTADHDTATLSAWLRLAPGPRVTFGRLAISGESRVRPERLREIAGLPEGEPFDPDALSKSADRLRRTGAFRSVALIEADTLGPGNSMDVTLQVVDDKRRRLGFGLEYATEEGISLTGFWLHRNLLGGAERLRFDAAISDIGGTESGGEDASLAVRFERPATFGPDNTFYVGAGLEHNDERDYREDTGQFGFGFTRIFSDRLEGDLGVVFRYSDVSDDLGTRQLGHLLLPATLTWDGRDDELDPRSGFYLAGGVTPFLGVSGEADSGVRLTADARAYRGIGERVVLAGRVQLGSVIGAEPDGLPPKMLFFSGGGGTVRGQPYESLAVELAADDRIGGRSFLGLSAEARIGVTRNIGVVTFADAGFIGPDSDFSEGDWHSGAGLGLRYNTGIGPIRVDVAAPVGGDTGDGVQLYIGIGQAF